MSSRSIQDQQGGRILGRWDQRDGGRNKRKREPIAFVLQKESKVRGLGSVRKELVPGRAHECLS